MFNNNYYFSDYKLNIQTNSGYINDSIRYYFSVYDNIEYFRDYCHTVDLIIDSTDNFKLTDLFEYIHKNSQKKYFVNKRFDIYQIDCDNFLISFYNKICIAELNIRTKKIKCFFEKPEQFGIDFIPNFIVIALIEILFKFENRFFIHSAALEKHGNTVIISGASGSGKSTLAFFLMNAGYKLLTDDKTYALIENNSIVIRGLLQPVDIIKGKDDFLINADIVKNIAQSLDDENKRIIISAFKPEKIGIKGRPHIILFPKVGESFSANKISAKNALVKLMRSSVTPNFNINLQTHFEILNKIVDNSKTYDILMDKDFSKILKFIDNL